MNKTDLIDKVAEATGIKKTEAKTQVEAVLAAIGDALIGGDKVELAGFGNFTTKVNPAKTARNPATGAEIAVPAKRVAKFKVAKAVQDRLAV